MLRWDIILIVVSVLLIVIILLLNRDCEHEDTRDCNRDEAVVDKCMRQSTHPSEGYCHEYKEIFAPPNTVWLKPLDCWKAIQKDCDCLDNYVMSYGKKGGHREYRCLCDKVSPCIHFVQGPNASGSNGYRRIGMAHYDGECPEGLPPSSFDEVGIGYCHKYKELAQAPSIEQCWDNVLDDPDCVDKIVFSYGKPDGSRALRCLCDTELPCTNLLGQTLGGNGFDRWYSNLPLPPAAPVYKWVFKSPGYCNTFKELPQVPTRNECWDNAQIDPACVNKDLITHGIPGGSRQNRCLCDINDPCPSIEGQGLGSNGFNRWERTLIHPPGTQFTDEGDGYCTSNLELLTQMTKEDCWEAIQSEPSCSNKKLFSYGKPGGSRAIRCLCDTDTPCPGLTGIGLGTDGFDRWREG